MSPVSWYRNVGKGTAYHRPAADWQRTGRSVCGAMIPAPAFVAPAGKIPEGHRACALCVRIEGENPAKVSGTDRA